MLHIRLRTFSINYNIFNLFFHALDNNKRDAPITRPLRTAFCRRMSGKATNKNKKQNSIINNEFLPNESENSLHNQRSQQKRFAKGLLKYLVAVSAIA